MTDLPDAAPRLLITMDEAAYLLRISRSKAYQLARRGELVGVIRVGDSLRVNRAKLEAWIEAGSSQGIAAKTHARPRLCRLTWRGPLQGDRSICALRADHRGMCRDVDGHRGWGTREPLKVEP